jgi:hypothetical protein
MTLRKVFCLAVVLLCSALLASARAAGPTCTNQSPRLLHPQTLPPYDATSSTSFVVSIGPDSIVYKPRSGGTTQTLYRCGQHYHYPTETPQGCRGELPPTGEPGTRPAPGQWVEVHTVYAAKVRHEGCDPETLDCCLEAPFLVRAFGAKVTAGGTAGPILVPTGRPLAEWSGSTTSPDKVPDECKPAAQWSFRLDCGFTLSEAQLKTFHHVDKARGLQTGSRLSKDLTLVRP